VKKDLKISVVTATWNCVETLPDCLGSVTKQRYSNKEHVVVDGGSTDGTLELIMRHADQIAVFRSERDQGIYDALNKGIRLSSGDVVGFLHADDFYASDSVLSLIASAFKDPSICAVYGDLEYVSKRDVSRIVRRWRSKPFSSESLRRGWMPAHPTLYVRRDWYLRVGGFDASYRISADYLLVLRLFSNPEFRAVYVAQTFVKMRVGGASNKSAVAMVRKSKEDWQALRSCGFGLFAAFFAIVWKNLGKVSQFIKNDFSLSNSS
jgi:glycosyltransferase involved in cell wall biosynthesis